MGGTTGTDGKSSKRGRDSSSSKTNTKAGSNSRTEGRQQQHNTKADSSSRMTTKVASAEQNQQGPQIETVPGWNRNRAAVENNKGAKGENILQNREPTTQLPQTTRSDTRNAESQPKNHRHWKQTSNQSSEGGAGRTWDLGPETRSRQGARVGAAVTKKPPEADTVRPSGGGGKRRGTGESEGPNPVREPSSQRQIRRFRGGPTDLGRRERRKTAAHGDGGARMGMHNPWRQKPREAARLETLIADGGTRQPPPPHHRRSEKPPRANRSATKRGGGEQRRLVGAAVEDDRKKI